VYVRVWEYDVPPTNTDAFVAAYDGDGDWAQLFKLSPAYLGTDLFRSVDGTNHFVTVDRWSDEIGWQAFLEQRRDDYAALGSRLAGLASGGRAVLEGAD
jgi:heme-degrading monooxygenase HmoA